MGAFLNDPSFVNAHLAPLPFKFQGHGGKRVTIHTQSGIESKCYYVPPAAGVTTAVVMVHEWWGLNDYIKREAFRLHDATGYGVFAMDLYGGQVATTPQEAGKLMGAVKEADAKVVITNVLYMLETGQLGPTFTKIGTIGWCFGGGWSLQTAIAGGDKVKACVMFYGMPDDKPEDLQRLQAPVLMVEAMKDKWISPTVVGEFRKSMRENHRSLTVRTYNEDHAFANPSNPHYSKADADDAMDATLRFFKDHLG
jgi:carboxymethylenebutenolidase